MLTSIPDLIKEIAPHTRRITAEAAHQERQQNDGLLIDVREPEEHAAKPAQNALNIPRGIVEMKMLAMEKDPQRPIYIHCATAARATLAAEQLQRVGYQNVSVITCDMDTIMSVLT